MHHSVSVGIRRTRFQPRSFWTILAVVFTVCLAPNTIMMAQDTVDAPSPSEEYRRLVAEAVRRAANEVLDSIVTIEIVGAGSGAAGEVAQDAPTSGVIVSDEGHVLTSSLVTRNTSASLLVVLPDGTRKAAKTIARDNHRELVLLKIETDQKLQAIQFSATEKKIGQTVVGVGRYGTESSPMVSRGVLSAVGRLDGIAIQTDARVSPALYGGLLIDLTGQVHGVLIPAIAEGGAEDITSWYDSGIAFAIPSETLAVKLERMIRGETIDKGVIGIVARTQDPYDDGTEVASVRVRSPAEEAGIRAGDVIERVADQPVRRHLDIKQSLGTFDAGDIVPVRIKRGEETIDLDVKLVKSIPPLEPQRVGVIATEQTTGDANSIVVDAILANSPASGKLEPGDVLQRVGETEIRDTSSLRRILLTAQPASLLKFTIKRGDKEQTVELAPESISLRAAPSMPPGWFDEKAKPWAIEAMKIPDAANVAAIVAPPANAETRQLGLLLLVLNPGSGEPGEVLKDWAQVASQNGVVVCAIAPQDNGRWQPQEVEVISRLAALLINQHPIDPTAVAVATTGALADQDSGASDSMALAIAITEKKTFGGVAVSPKTRPPAIRITENDPQSPLQFYLPVADESEFPNWSAPLKQAGYPIVTGGKTTTQDLLTWVRLLQAI